MIGLALLGTVLTGAAADEAIAFRCRAVTPEGQVLAFAGDLKRTADAWQIEVRDLGKTLVGKMTGWKVGSIYQGHYGASAFGEGRLYDFIFDFAPWSSLTPTVEIRRYPSGGQTRSPESYAIGHCSAVQDGKEDHATAQVPM